MDSEQRLELRRSLDLYRDVNKKDLVVECAVMATDFEQYHLERQLEERGIRSQKYFTHDLHDGLCMRIGEAEQLPIAIRIRFRRINGRLVCFFVPTSRFVDHDLVKQWILDVILPAPDGETRLCESALDFITLLRDRELIPRLPR